MNKEYDMTTNKLKEYRMKLNLRQEDAAKLLGMDCKDRISHWENGKSIPSIINLYRLSVIYGVLPHELYLTLFESIKNDYQISQLV